MQREPIQQHSLSTSIYLSLASLWCLAVCQQHDDLTCIDRWWWEPVCFQIPLFVLVARRRMVLWSVLSEGFDGLARPPQRMHTRPAILYLHYAHSTCVCFAYQYRGVIDRCALKVPNNVGGTRPGGSTQVRKHL